MAITGLTSTTPDKLLLDAGAFFKNYDLSKAYSAQTDALIGATSGGGSFSAVPEVRKLEVDGAKTNVKGLKTIDQWTVTMEANVKELTAENLQLALGSTTTSTATETGVTGATKIVGNADIADGDYVNNITWVGRLSGSSQPVVIVIKNAYCENGLNLTVKDKDEAVVTITLTANYSLDDLDTPPFAIYYPAS